MLGETERPLAQAAYDFKAKITKVEAIPLHVPFRRIFKNPASTWPYSEVLLVRLTTSDGISGTGETQAWRRAGSYDTLPNMVRIIKDFFEPRLLGRSPFDIAPIMKSLNEALDHNYYTKAAISD